MASYFLWRGDGNWMVNMIWPFKTAERSGRCYHWLILKVDTLYGSFIRKNTFPVVLGYLKNWIEANTWNFLTKMLHPTTSQNYGQNSSKRVSLKVNSPDYHFTCHKPFIKYHTYILSSLIIAPGDRQANWLEKWLTIFLMCILVQNYDPYKKFHSQCKIRTGQSIFVINDYLSTKKWKEKLKKYFQ